MEFDIAEAPQKDHAFDTVTQCFLLLNNFDIPIGIEHAESEVVEIPSATQWTSVLDTTGLKVYYRTFYNSNIRCIDLNSIDLNKVTYQYHPLDITHDQPIEYITIT